MTAPSNRRLQFADRLRQIRKDKMNGKLFAEAAQWQPSKLSRIENAQSMISEQDLTHWASVLGLSDAVVEELRAELKAIRLDEARWKSRLRAGGHEGVQLSFAEAERNASTIVAFETAFVPGLLQTPAYARAVFESMAALKETGDDIDAAVSARMQRQSVLYDDTKDIQLIVCEAALRNPVASPEVMAGQLDRLVAVTGLPNVRFGILPFDVQLPFAPVHGFWLLDDFLSVETLHTEIATRDPEDIRPYSTFFSAMWRHAAERELARALLLGIAQRG